MGSGGIDGAGAGNDSRAPDADLRDSRGRRGRGLSGLTRSLRSDRREDEDLVYADGLRYNLHPFAGLSGNAPDTNKLTCASRALAFLLLFTIEIQ